MNKIIVSQFKQLLCYICSIVNKILTVICDLKVLVFILFKLKKCPNISGIWVVYIYIYIYSICFTI